MVKISLDKDAPNTNAILGALLSGGDPVKLAKMMTEPDADGKDEKK